MKTKFLTSLLALVVLLACSEDQNAGPSPHSKQDSAIGTTEHNQAANDTVTSALKLVPALANTDSVQVLYYDNPDGDSLRYARFFKYTAVTDTGFLNELGLCLQQPVSIEPVVRKCRSIGKMYLLQGDQPLKTMYFSDRADSCSYIYFIQNGSFIYLEMPSLLNEKLMKLKTLSKAP